MHHLHYYHCYCWRPLALIVFQAETLVLMTIERLQNRSCVSVRLNSGIVAVVCPMQKKKNGNDDEGGR
jgi:hypothetical protein